LKLVCASVISLTGFVLAACSVGGGLSESDVTPIVPPTPSPESAPVLADQGTIEGVLANGTVGAAISAGQMVTLYALTPDGGAPMFTRTAASDAGGHFVFDNLAASPAILYVVQTSYQQVHYVSAPLIFAHGGLTLTTPITVYETTDDASSIRVEQLHLFLSFAPGRVKVEELFIIVNSGDRAYIAGDGMSLHFYLPPGAENVRFGDGGRYKLTTEGFADTQAVVPGAAQVAAAYELSYNGSRLDLELVMSYPVRSIVVLAPEAGLRLNSAQLTAAGWRQTQSGSMMSYVGGNLAAGQSLVLHLSGAPGVAPNEAAMPLLPLIGAALLLVAASAIAYVWLRRRQCADESAVESEGVDTRREELLDAIAALDDDFEAGHLAESDYRRKRAELKAELMELENGLTR